VNLFGFSILWMILLFSFQYFSDAHREGDIKDVIEKRNKILAMLLIPIFLGIITLTFSPEICEFKFIY